MPRKKKDPNEMTDKELIERVFPKRVVKEVNREIGLMEDGKDEKMDDSTSDGK